jgi:hypothetical protein
LYKEDSNIWDSINCVSCDSIALSGDYMPLSISWTTRLLSAGWRDAFHQLDETTPSISWTTRRLLSAERRDAFHQLDDTTPSISWTTRCLPPLYRPHFEYRLLTSPTGHGICLSPTMGGESFSCVHILIKQDPSVNIFICNCFFLHNTIKIIHIYHYINTI